MISIAVLTVLGLGAAGGAALATSKLHVLSRACVATKSRALTAPVSGRCPKGTLLEQVGSSTPRHTGPAGAPGATGAQGPQGPQGPAGAAATAKSYVVNYEQGGHAPVNASPGVTLSAGPYDNEAGHSEDTYWHFPADISICAIAVTTVESNGLYAVEGGGSSVTGPIAQAGRNPSDPHIVYVDTEWPGGTGTSFSLLVTCP
jgi:hypothetical protein